MRKSFIFLSILLILMVQWSVFAGGGQESIRHNAYVGGGMRYYLDEDSFAAGFGAGYEYGLTDSISLGAYAGGILGEGSGYEVLFKPRFYPFNNGIKDFFIGANLGYSGYSYSSNDYDNNNYYYNDYNYDYNYGYNYGYNSYGFTNEGFTAGINLGWKFILGSGSGGVSIEPSAGYDFLRNRVHSGISVGYAWGGGQRDPAPRPVAVTPRVATSSVQDGIYVGIIAFGSDAIDLTGGAPILLDSAGRTQLINLINTRYEKESIVGTTLFYAAHMALANLKKAESKLPSILQSATMVTFTDGFDNGSSGLRRAEITDPAGRSSLTFRADRAGDNAIEMYRDYIQREIRAPRAINRTPLEAYILAIRGDDVTDVTSFEAARSSLASVGDKYGGNRNITWDELILTFNQIASSIVADMTHTSFTMVSPEYPPGTRIRMTFNGETTAQAAQNAQLYFEGEVAVKGMENYLTNIRYSGGISSSIPVGGEVKGEYNRAGELTYLLPDFEGFDFDKYNQSELDRLLRQWQMSRGGTAWQINSEYRPIDVSVREIKRHNAVIYLVLDKSISIADVDVPRVKEAAIGFIQRLYDGYYGR